MRVVSLNPSNPKQLGHGSTMVIPKSNQVSHPPATSLWCGVGIVPHLEVQDGYAKVSWWWPLPASSRILGLTWLSSRYISLPKKKSSIEFFIWNLRSLNFLVKHANPTSLPREWKIKSDPLSHCDPCSTATRRPQLKCRPAFRSNCFADRRS